MNRSADIKYIARRVKVDFREERRIVHTQLLDSTADAKQLASAWQKGFSLNMLKEQIKAMGCV